MAPVFRGIAVFMVGLGLKMSLGESLRIRFPRAGFIMAWGAGDIVYLWKWRHGWAGLGYNTSNADCPSMLPRRTAIYVGNWQKVQHRSSWVLGTVIEFFRKSAMAYPAGLHRSEESVGGGMSRAGRDCGSK